MRPPEDAVAASTLTGQSLPIANDDTVRRYTRELIGRHRRAFLTVIALTCFAGNTSRRRRSGYMEQRKTSCSRVKPVPGKPLSSNRWLPD